MTTNDVTHRVNTLGSAWEQFKAINDRRLMEVKTNGVADPLTEEQLKKVNHFIDGHKDKINLLETTTSRPFSGDSGYYTNSGVENEYKKAFCQYVRKGIEGDLPTLEGKALSVGSDPEGGYLVTPSMTQKIIQTIFETSPMRKLCAVEIIGSDTLEIIDDHDEAFAGWTSETASITSDTATPVIAKKVIPVHELYAQPKATQKLVDDSSIDIEAWLSTKLADVFSRKENAAFVNGDGVGKPRGILTYPSGTTWGKIEQINSGSSGAVTSDSIIKLYYALKEDYATRSSFLMNRSTVQAVRLLKDTHNQYIWQPGLALGAPDTLLGVPAYQAADLPVPAANSLSVVVADFARAYQIVDRIGIRVLRDPFTDKPFIKFYTTKRVGGDVVNFEAIKIMKLAA